MSINYRLFFLAACLKVKNMQFFKILAVILALGLPLQASAADLNKPAPAAQSPIKIVKSFKLRLPIACKIGTDCWVMNYPDVGPDADGVATDPFCTARTYDGHKGTDIMIADKAAMDAGVNVLAARDGVVTRVRDNVDDHFPLTDAQRAQIKTDKKECGNAVLIDHGDGWQTMYCHMKRGSTVVTPQQKIKAGDKIGQVGASGDTQFPHVHLGVIHKSIVIDPFTGNDIKDACGEAGAPLFEKAAGLVFEPLAFMKFGFSDAPIKLEELDQGRKFLEEIKPDAPALVFTAIILGVRAGDKISLRIEDPEGKIFSENKVTQDKDRARQMLFVGRKIPKDLPLNTGLYTGKIEILRKDKDGNEEKFSKVRAVRVE
jgi:murein DD-endopeptidase MepM/ murein hydrolase activator NlpD